MLRCLQKSPVKRYASAEELRERLLAVVSTLDERTATSPRSPTKSKRPRRHIQRLQLPSKGQNDRDSFAQPSSPRSTSSRHVLLPLSGATALWVLATTIALGALLAWAYKTWF